MSKRKWKRWVLLVSPTKLLETAKSVGMACISCGTVSMCVHTQIGLYGTSEQIKKLEAIWKEKKYEFVNRQPTYAFDITVNKPREDWAYTP